MAKKGEVKFIRRGGRVIPISIKKEISTAGEIASSKNHGSLGKVVAASSASLGMLYASGRIDRKSNALTRIKKITSSSRLNRLAKFTKFGGKSLAALVAGAALTSIDKRTSDEGAKLLNIGSQAATPLGTAAQIAAAYGAYRFGKRFEYAGKLGKNLFNFKDIKSMKKLRAI